MNEQTQVDQSIMKEFIFRTSKVLFTTLDSHAASNFYASEIEIWAGFRPVGRTEKKWGRLLPTFECNFLIFHMQKKSLIFFLIL